jgi:anti-sigma28 factor (negative regulator of flagellin synthesis)
MRIDSLSAGRSYALRPTESPGVTTVQGTPSASATTDLRDLSTQAQLLLSARQAALQGVTQRADRVADLQQQVAAGAYTANAGQVCDALIHQFAEVEERS